MQSEDNRAEKPMEGVDQIIELALGLHGTPWRLESVTLDKEKRLVTIRLGFEKGAAFPHPLTGEMLVCEAAEERVWRHMNFFQYRCEVRAPLPLVGRGGADGPPRQSVGVPWAQPGSGFTLLFEAMWIGPPGGGITKTCSTDTILDYGDQSLQSPEHPHAAPDPSWTAKPILARILRAKIPSADPTHPERQPSQGCRTAHRSRWKELPLNACLLEVLREMASGFEKSHLPNAAARALNGLLQAIQPRSRISTRIAATTEP